MEKRKVVCPHCGQVNAIPVKPFYTKANCGRCKHSLLDTKPVELDGAGFELQTANSDIPVIVDFWAPWCGPCRMMAPAFEQAASAFPLTARFAKVNTEEEQQLAGRFGIRSIPTLIAFKGGREIDRVSGALSADQLRQWVGRFI